MTQLPQTKRLAEFTPVAVALGVVLSLVMCAANVYLGLYAGMTVSASIPAAVISMGILRGALRRGTILENNIVQTMASAGESLAAGIIFTMPALLIAGLWTEFNYWKVTLIAITGGMLGVLFMIPLRRPLIVEEKELAYPEGVACAEVLQAGDRGGRGVAVALASLAGGAAFKFLVTGVTVFKAALEWGTRAGRGVFYFGADMSPALLGVGYIVGLNVAALVFLGGCIGWIAGVPLHAILDGAPADVPPIDFAWGVWDKQVRYMGVGAMLAGGVWSIIGVRRGIVTGLRESAAGFRRRADGNQRLPEDTDIPSVAIALLLGATVAAVFAIYAWSTGGAAIAGAATVLMLLAAFLFVAVSSYIAGLVGSSNNPVSGMTICTVLLTGLALKLMGMQGAQAMLATLCVAGVVCCAAATSADCSQDLKTGALVGATPARQQWAQIIGVVTAAFVIAPVLVVLHESYGIGTGAPGALKAPQASLFASLARGMFGAGELPWPMIGLGLGIGTGIIALDEILKAADARFRAYVMPVAVGIYLPLSLSVPMFAGGILAHLTRNSNRAHAGVLCSSGLIAGEAITGIAVGAAMYFGSGVLPVSVSAPPALTLAAAAAVMGGLWIVSRNGQGK